MSLIRNAGLVLLVTVMLGCATQTAMTSPLGRPYSAAELKTIMDMRDEGEGLADVARVVGGTRRQIKQAESVEKRRRRTGLALASDPAAVAGQ